MTQPAAAVRAIRSHAIAFAIPLAFVLWAYWGPLTAAAESWATEPQYSHGYLVPAFALVLLWLRRSKLSAADLRPSWSGLAVLAGATAVRLYGAKTGYVWLDGLSLLPCLAGALLLVAGWHYLRWAWPAIAFLFFMIPLAYRVEVAMGRDLQTLATEASTFLLQTVGRPAVAEGNVIHINEVQLGVVDACSGLRMLMVFFALSTAVALLSRKPLWERLLIGASAVPIALVTNLLRITATGLLHEALGKKIIDGIVHDVAGWLMMPLALGFLALELKLLKHLLVAPPSAAPALAAALPHAPAPTPVLPAAPRSEKPAAAPRPPRRRRQSRPEVAKPFTRS